MAVGLGAFRGGLLFVESSKAFEHPTRGQSNHKSKRRNANEPYYEIKIALDGRVIASPRKVT